jgi:hypothetical protein
MVAMQMVAGLEMQAPQTTTRRRHGHLARTLTMASLTIALLLGMFGVGGVGPQAVQDLFVEDAAAAGPCNVWSQVKLTSYNGYYYIYGRGTADCSYYGNQGIGVGLYGNGVLLKSRSVVLNGIKTFAVNSNAALGYCGVKYQVAVVHTFNDGYQTIHWSQPYYLC